MLTMNSDFVKGAAFSGICCLSFMTIALTTISWSQSDPTSDPTLQVSVSVAVENLRQETAKMHELLENVIQGETPRPENLSAEMMHKLLENVSQGMMPRPENLRAETMHELFENLTQGMMTRLRGGMHELSENVTQGTTTRLKDGQTNGDSEEEQPLWGWDNPSPPPPDDIRSRKGIPQTDACRTPLGDITEEEAPMSKSRLFPAVFRTDWENAAEFVPKMNQPSICKGRYFYYPDCEGTAGIGTRWWFAQNAMFIAETTGLKYVMRRAMFMSRAGESKNGWDQNDCYSLYKTGDAQWRQCFTKETTLEGYRFFNFPSIDSNECDEFALEEAIRRGEMNVIYTQPIHVEDYKMMGKCPPEYNPKGFYSIIKRTRDLDNVVYISYGPDMCPDTGGPSSRLSGPRFNDAWRRHYWTPEIEIPHARAPEDQKLPWEDENHPLYTGNNSDMVNVVIHWRSGDRYTDDTYKNNKQSSLGAKYFLKILEHMFSETDLTENNANVIIVAQKPTQAAFKTVDDTAILKEFPKVHFHWGTDDTTFLDLRMFIHSDVFVLSDSAYGAMAGTFHRGIKLFPMDAPTTNVVCRGKWDLTSSPEEIQSCTGTMNTIGIGSNPDVPEDLGRFDAARFNQMLDEFRKDRKAFLNVHDDKHKKIGGCTEKLDGAEL